MSNVVYRSTLDLQTGETVRTPIRVVYDAEGTPLMLELSDPIPDGYAEHTEPTE